MCNLVLLAARPPEWTHERFIDRWRGEHADGTVLGPGATGRAQVRGPSLFLGQVRDGRAEPLTLTPEGFFPTGDLLVTGEDGAVTVMGREKDVSKAKWPEFAFTVDELPQTTVGKLDRSGARRLAHDLHAQLATHPEQHLQGDA